MEAEDNNQFDEQPDSQETGDLLAAEPEADSEEVMEADAAPEVAVAAAEPAAPAGPPPIGEQELLAISAALAAYFGVRVHVRQIRLITSSAWAQQGRVSIQASHRLF